jgi:tRNA/rRNA methyltransferase
MNPRFTLENVRVVLSHASHPGNIGATARAMKTMGLRSLFLVNPRSFPDRQAEIRAAGGWDILNNATVCSRLEEALSDTILAAAVTARPRMLSHEVFDARQGARELVASAVQYPVALVFGREASGLTSQEAGMCQIVVHIPSNPDYSSLNLASAVQVMAYEIRMALSEPPARLPEGGSQPATSSQIELLSRHLERVGVESGFIDPHEPKRFIARMRRLFARARLEEEEVGALRGFLSAAERRMQIRE